MARFDGVISDLTTIANQLSTSARSANGLASAAGRLVTVSNTLASGGGGVSNLADGSGGTGAGTFGTVQEGWAESSVRRRGGG